MFSNITGPVGIAKIGKMLPSVNSTFGLGPYSQDVEQKVRASSLVKSIYVCILFNINTTITL